MRHPHLSLITALRPALLLLIVAACQSYQPVTYPAETHLPRDPKTEVRVTEKSGTRTRLVETRIENDSIVGRDFVSGERRQAIAMADVVNLEIGEPDTAKTAGLTVGVILGVPVAFALLLLFSFSHYHGT